MKTKAKVVKKKKKVEALPPIHKVKTFPKEVFPTVKLHVQLESPSTSIFSIKNIINPY